jgi:hypothetical protein
MNAFPEALTPVKLSVRDEIGPEVPLTVIFDWALTAVLSGTVIGVAFANTTSESIELSAGCASAAGASLGSKDGLAMTAPTGMAIRLSKIEKVIVRAVRKDGNPARCWRTFKFAFFMAVMLGTASVKGRGIPSIGTSSGKS